VLEVGQFDKDVFLPGGSVPPLSAIVVENGVNCLSFHFK
jgi:hypothetical protein